MSDSWRDCQRLTVFRFAFPVFVLFRRALFDHEKFFNWHSHCGLISKKHLQAYIQAVPINESYYDEPDSFQKLMQRR